MRTTASRPTNYRKRSHTKPPHKFAFFTDRDLGNHVPDALERAGYRVERHSAHFRHDIADAEFLPIVGRQPDWIALTKDKGQRYNPDERDAIMRSGVALFIHVGRLSHPLLADSLVMQADRILRFRDRHEPPFIAKVYRPEVRTRYRIAPGRIEMNLTLEQWKRLVGGKRR